MPRNWEPKHGVSPFADYLIERMQAHNPPMRPHHLAEALSIDSAVVSAWLAKGSIPRRETIAAIAYVFGDAREPWYMAAGIPMWGRPARRVPTALMLPTPESFELWEAQMEQAVAMPWSKDRKANFIRDLKELYEELVNRGRFEIPPSAYDSTIDFYRTYSDDSPEAKERLIDHMRRMQAQYGLPEREADEQTEQTAGPDDTATRRRARQHRPT
jgi:hypothetical protein